MKRRNAGFTLIEIMVAMFVLALTFVGVISSATYVSRSIMSLEEKTQALWVVQNVMSEMQLGLPHVNPVLMGGKTWYYTITSEPEGEFARVTLRVSRDRQAHVLAEKVFYAAP